jgi:hypothetical protein
MIKLNGDTIGGKEINTDGNFSQKDTNTISNSPQSQYSSLSDLRSNEYSEAMRVNQSPMSTNFGISGPLNEGYQDSGIGKGQVSYKLDGVNNSISTNRPPITKKTTPPKTISEKISVDSGPSGSGGFSNISLGDYSVKPVKFGKVDLSGGKPNETQALTPREMRRNQRNVKFLKRRIRKGERKGDDMTSTRQALGNAQAQQAGNFKPGQKFKTPTGTGSYVTPKQNREKNGSVIGNTLKNTFGKKEGGSKVGNALRNAGGIFKKKTKTGGGFGGF